MTNYPRIPLPQTLGKMLHSKEVPKGKLLAVGQQQIVLKLSKLFFKLSTEAHSAVKRLDTIKNK